MFATQRHKRILERIRLNGSVRVADLVDELGVSDMTLHRDISVLAADGLLQRVHGGATAVGSRTADEPGFAAKSVQQTAQKAAIAGMAASPVKPGSSVALSGGTTTYGVAAALKPLSHLMVVTNSLPVADVLHDRPATT